MNVECRSSHVCTKIFLGLVLWLTGCSTSSPRELTVPQSDWLSEVGFFDRGTWASTELHLTRTEIGSAGSLTDLLRQQDWIRVQATPPEGWGIEQLNIPEGSTCEVHLYLNGTLLEQARGSEKVGIDWLIPRGSIDGLEYHIGPGGPILEDDDCGSLLIWSGEMRARRDPQFRGSIVGQVLSSPPDSVIRVELQPMGSSSIPEAGGTFVFLDLLPGEYQLAFFTPTGPVIKRDVRVFAFRESRLELEVGRDPSHRPPARR